MKTHKEFIPVLIAIIFVALPTILCIIRTDNLEKKVEQQQKMIEAMMECDSLALENITALSLRDNQILERIVTLSKNGNQTIELFLNHLEYNH